MSDNNNAQKFQWRRLFAKRKKRQEQQQQQQVLLTKKSLALALSAPRAPPLGSAHRSLLLGNGPYCSSSWRSWTHHYRVRELHHDSHNHEHEMLEHEQGTHGALLLAHATLVQERLRQRLQRRHRHRSLPHPHLLSGPELGDSVTRCLGRILPLAWQHRARDSGMARSLVDGIVTSSAPPLLALQKPSAVVDFISLSRRVQRVSYGSHERQYIDLLEPNNEHERRSKKDCRTGDATDDESYCNNRRRLVFFVHGGAWGSGYAWMYRLVSKAFLQQGYAVAILNYRVYPTSTSTSTTTDASNNNNNNNSSNNNKQSVAAAAAILDQVQDCHLAARHLQRHYPHYAQNVTVMGHSSGAHVALYWLVERAKLQMKRKKTYACSSLQKASLPSQHEEQNADLLEPLLPLSVDSYIGIAGPYDISHHFDYEAARGVEEFSPMKPVCGYTRRQFRQHSPALNLLDSLANTSSSNDVVVVEHYFPPIVLVHGVEDETVPFTSTAEAARVLRSCGVVNVQELYNESVQHQEAVLQLMVGGTVLEEILDWIRRLPTQPTPSPGMSSTPTARTTTRAPPVIRSKL